MTSIRKDLAAVSRREFLKASGLSAGGLIVGVSLPVSLLGSAASTEFQPNAFVYIAKSGDTTIWCGRCEMGQGISTALPAAVADELEADWARVSVLQGDANKKFGPQATGGSNSINQMLEPMRKAGAAGREMLVAAAAQTWNLPVDKCYAKLHVVYNHVDDRSLPYGDLVELAAELTAPEDPVLKTSDQFRYIGKPLQRHDQADMVVGQRVYGADSKVPGVKYAAISHVPVLGGTVKSFDKAAAMEVPGVVDVVLIPRFENAYGSVGGVAVVADNTWTAQQGLTKLNIEFEAGENGSYNTTEYKKQLVKNVEVPATKEFEKGALEQAFELAAVRHKATYVGGHLSHSPMEPMASLVWVQDDKCEIWASTQDPAGIQKTIGAYLDRKPEDITVHVMASGGAFGRKFKCDYVQEAAACSKAVGAPVQLTWSREEDTQTGYYHSCSAQHIEASVDADGKVTGWLHRAAFPAIGSTFNPAVVQPTAGDLDAVSKHPYGIENMQVESGMAKAHTRIGWYRAVYAIFYGFAINVFTDELAHAAGVDTVQFLRNIYDNNKVAEQQEQAKRCRGVLDKAAEMADWGKKLPANQGMGIAVHHSFHSYVAMVVHVETNGDDITVKRVDCAVDCGLVLNPDIATAQMEGAIIMGVGLALNTEISFEDGAVVNSNFHDYPVLHIGDAPAEMNISFINQGVSPTGLGEPGVPTLAPALANAVYAANGKRHRSIPINPA
ncbi:MAG: molybdopterin-dependent oxidoreductase [Xanthomonadales bacterium]|nr:molybdopterin-dependent oxidoreductase [Xanthomonadales bacterium]